MILIRQTIEAARQGMILLLGNRLVLVLGIVIAVAAMVAVAYPDRFARGHRGDDVFGYPTYIIVFVFGMPTVISYLGLWLIHEEISDRSAVHVFVQPVHRVCLLLGRWLSVAVLGAALGALAVGAYWLALAVPDRPWRRGLAPTDETLFAFLKGCLLAAPGYAAVGVFCGAAFRRPLIVAILFVVGWEGLVSNVPPQAGVREWTVADPVRRAIVDSIRDVEGTGLADALQVTLRGPGIEQMKPPLESLIWFTAVVLVASMFVYSRREYDARARD